jgi:hypothetical protein
VLGSIRDVGFAEDQELFIASLKFAGFALEP